MCKLIETPHLPKGRVRHIIIGEKYKNLLENALLEYNLEPIWLKSNMFVDERLSGHVDLAAVHIKNRIVISEHLKHCEQIHKLIEVEHTANSSKPIYPYDAGLNFCVVEDKLFYNPKSANKSLICKAGSNQLIAVKQGYTKCSICVVDENSIITGDRSIAAAAEKHKMNVLYIEEPFVELEGFDYGFIGGAAFKISKAELAFTGIINNVQIKESIESFLNERKISPVYLTDRTIFDIGSAIPLTEYIT